MSFDRLAAVSDSRNSHVTATTDEWSVDDAGIDQFELEASRRILANLRTELYGQKMWDLLGGQIDAAEKQFQQWYAESDGEYRGGEVKLRLRGISSDQLMGAFMQILGPAMADGEERRQGSINGVFPAHPEHYGLSVEGPGGVETMGGMPTLTFPAYVGDDEVPDFIAPLIDTSYDISRVGRGLLRDGSAQSYVLQQLRDVEGDLEVSLWIWYPAACPDSVVKEHLQHYAVEFRNGARMAAAMIRANAAAEDDTHVSTGAAPADGIAGTWRLEGSAGPAKREFDLHLTTDGAVARGALTSQDGRTVELDNGIVDGSTVVFKANMGMKVTFTLAFDGDAVAGKMKAGIMPATALTGARREAA